MSNAVPSFAEFAAQAKENMAKETGGAIFLSKLPLGVYDMQFLGATMVKNEFGSGYIPEYKFNHDGVEKSLRSASQSLAAGLMGREGQAIKLEIGQAKKTGRKFYGIK